MSVHFMSLGAGIGFPCRQSFLWLSRVALHLCNQKRSRELSISLGLRARNISGDVTHVGSDAGSITLELVEFELLCAYTHIAMDSPSKCLQHLCVVSKKVRLEHTNLT